MSRRLQQQKLADETLEKSELVLFNEYDKMEKGIADRDVYIIMLQMKLLAEKEESEKLKMKVEEIEHKNEKMARELRRVSQNYNQERWVKLSGYCLDLVVLIVVMVVFLLLVVPVVDVAV